MDGYVSYRKWDRDTDIAYAVGVGVALWYTDEFTVADALVVAVSISLILWGARALRRRAFRWFAERSEAQK